MQQVNSTYTLLPTGVENGNDLIRKTLGEVYKELVNAVDRVPQEKTKERKYATILSASERSRLLVDKLITVLKWSKNVDVIDRCGSLVIYDNDNLNTMTNVAMTLNAAVFRLQACLQPIYPHKIGPVRAERRGVSFYPAGVRQQGAVSVAPDEEGRKRPHHADPANAHSHGRRSVLLPQHYGS